MHLRRAPSLPALRPFVEHVWAADEERSRAPRERVLPSGQAHLVVRVSDHPLRVYARPDARQAQAFPFAVLGGPRWSAYVRDVSRPIRSVGAQLRPGVLSFLFGVTADRLADQHTPLEALWPDARFRERLRELDGLPDRLERFEALLAERLPRAGELHPAVAHALERFGATSDVGRVARETGYNHRHFVTLFTEAVGMPPKRFCRVRRLDLVLRRLTARPETAWSELAASARFSDQAHLIREFRALSGLTPGRYRALAPDASRHVPLA